MPPRPPSRRRSSQKRVSLVAGRLKVIDDPGEIYNGNLSPHILGRQSSQSSILSVVSTRAPSPTTENFLGSHTINDFVIEGEAGRGAYGLVKRAREKLSNGKFGVSFVSTTIESPCKRLCIASFDHKASHQISHFG